MEDDIFDGIIGGRRLSKNLIRKDVVEPDNSELSSELDRKISRLLALHPELVRFRGNSFENLDEPTKQALLEDMYDILGIIPLRNE